MYSNILEVIDNIVASTHMEGLVVSSEAIKDMHKVDQGHMTTEEAVKRSIRRLSIEKVQRPE